MLGLTGCSKIFQRFTPTEPIVICSEPPELDKLSFLRVTWLDIKDTTGRIYIALTGSEYEKLALNMSKIKKQLKNHQSRDQYFQACINRIKQQSGENDVND